jgi:hypothetical protein
MGEIVAEFTVRILFKENEKLSFMFIRLIQHQ